MSITALTNKSIPGVVGMMGSAAAQLPVSFLMLNTALPFPGAARSNHLSWVISDPGKLQPLRIDLVSIALLHGDTQKHTHSFMGVSALFQMPPALGTRTTSVQKSSCKAAQTHATELVSADMSSLLESALFPYQ